MDPGCHSILYSFSVCRMKKPCLTYKVWQVKDRCTVGKAVVVKFSPWEEESDSWSDVSSIHLYIFANFYTLVCNSAYGTSSHLWYMQVYE